MSYKKIKKGKGKPNPKNKYEIKLGTPSNLVQQKINAEFGDIKATETGAGG